MGSVVPFGDRDTLAIQKTRHGGGGNITSGDESTALASQPERGGDPTASGAYGVNTLAP
jgi:hypothetical protein